MCDLNDIRWFVGVLGFQMIWMTALLGLSACLISAIWKAINGK